MVKARALLNFGPLCTNLGGVALLAMLSGAALGYFAGVRSESAPPAVLSRPVSTQNPSIDVHSLSYGAEPVLLGSSQGPTTAAALFPEAASTPVASPPKALPPAYQVVVAAADRMLLKTIVTR